jgi:type III restriction enzyme
MFRLKDYQQRALDTLSRYFQECSRLGDAELAFYEVTREVFGRGIPYHPVQELPGLPYVCLRLPTGGGKTVLACHAAGAAVSGYLRTERAVVLWLVPSNAIREQTLKALRDQEHPYRQALDASLGDVAVADISEALAVRRAVLDAQTTIIVSTMQAFRVQDTEGRKVYEDSGGLMGHFDGLPAEAVERLECYSDGQPKRSLANVLRLRRPILIVDEAHNARTGLAFDTLARFDPACILEFTATPDLEPPTPSNVLHSVSAAELAAESMIKMPIRLETRIDWRELLTDAVGVRNALEAAARREAQVTGEYLRPIMLLQAQPHFQDRQSLTVEVVRQALLDDHHVPSDQVAVATGSQYEIEGVDLSDRDCPVRYIITVQALREGWDCPFAYVLCSVAELRAATAVEQILGRVMRLPGAQRKTEPELNLAYAFSASASFAEAANALTDALIQNGFERQEARDLILEPATRVPTLPFETPAPPASVLVLEAPRLEQLEGTISAKVRYDPLANRLTYDGVMEIRERNSLLGCFTSLEGRQAVELLYRRSRGMVTAASRGTRPPMAVPLLCIQRGGLLEPLDETYFLEAPWSLAESDASLSEDEFPATRPSGQVVEITVDDTGHLRTRFLEDLKTQLMLLSPTSGWTEAGLVFWLDRIIPHVDIQATDSRLFLMRMVRDLVDGRRIPLEALVIDKYRLGDAAMRKIAGHRRRARARAFQALLLPDCRTPIAVAPDAVFAFDPSPANYPYSRRYEGGYDFTKHYYPHVGDLLGSGEEFECARFLDTMPEVDVWVRNLERRPSHAFWLQTTTDRFYPDFVCRLRDARYLVVEYKGADRYSNEDSREKRMIGELWERSSQGQCLFVMTNGPNLDAIRAKIAQRS